MTTLILQLVLAALLAAQSQAGPSSEPGYANWQSSGHGIPSLAERMPPEPVFMDSGSNPLPGSNIGQPAQAIKGTATWYDAPSIHDAAAGPALREAIGKHWRGTWVTVGGIEDPIRLSDWCACRDRNGKPTLLDLDDRAFRELAPLSRGVVPVTVSWGAEIPLPATDTE